MLAKFMRNRTSAVVATVGIVLWLGAAHTTAAQPSDEQAQAEYSKGVDLFKQKKPAEACLAFEASRKLSLLPQPKTLFNLALCRQQIGQLAAAWRLLQEVERLTRDKAGSEEKEIHESALKTANQIEEEMSRRPMSKLTIEVPTESQIHGLDIRLDTEVVEPKTWNRALPIDGGTYTITARAPGAVPWMITVKVTSGTDNKVVEIPRLVTPAPPTLNRPVVPTTDSSMQPRTRSLPFVLAVGGGALLLSSAAGFYLWALSGYHDASGEMVNQARRDSLESSANARRHVALGMGVAGLACGGVAAWLHITGRATATSATATSRARVHVVPSVGGATGTGLMVLGGF